MFRTIKTHKNILIVSMPLLIISAMVMIADSSVFTKAPNKFALAITIDLLLIVPCLYVLLVSKTKIPNTTVVPFIILGVIVCSFIIPEENQFYLSLFKTWCLPLIELSILIFIIYNVTKTIRLYKLNKNKKTLDFYSILKITCDDILPKAAVIPFVTEIAVFYYGFVNWKKRNLDDNEFSYHKESGTISLLIGIMILIAVETITIHFLLVNWNITVAWIVTGLSIYTGIQIIGFSRSISERPIIVENEFLYLRFGIMTETTIKLNNIESIKISTKDIELNNDTKKLSFLGSLDSHNMVIKLKKEETLTGLYGRKKSYKTLAFHIDEKDKFMSLIKQKINT